MGRKLGQVVCGISLLGIAGCTGGSNSGAIPQFTSCGDEAIAVRSDSTERRLYAAKRLEGCSPAIAVPPLIEQLRREDDHVNSWRISLTLSKFPGTRKGIATLLKSKDADLRYYATVAVNPNDASNFSHLMRDSDPRVRETFASKLIGRDREALRSAVAVEKDPEVLEAMKRFLRQEKPASARRRSIEEILEREKKVFLNR